MNSPKTAFQLEIIAKITHLRQKNGLTQVQIAEVLDLGSAGQIGNIESPKYPHKYTLEQIYKIVTYLNYSIETIFLTENELQKPVSEIINILFAKLIEYEKR